MNQHRFVWHDLNTNDVEGAKRFYGEVFNWKFEGSEREYVHVSAGDRMIGGMRKLGANEHQPPAWLGYVLVEDVAATVATIEKQPETHPAVPAPGTFCWDELVTTDPDAAGKFYAAVFGWQPHPVEMGGGM